jgi:CPA2 family monovalent cation:H+ antiporter-2
MENIFVKEIVIILFVAFIGGYFFLKLKQPPFVGYLISGIIIALPIFSGTVRFEISQDIAQVGVALLLFAAGIEFPISKILSIKKTLLMGTALQLVIFIIIAKFVFSQIGFTPKESLFLAAAFTNSSTIVVIPLLEQRLLKGSKISDYVTGWLILQDIAIIAIAVLVGIFLGSESFTSYDILEAVAKSFLFISFSILLGKHIIPDVFDALSRLRSSELLLILSFVFCMTTAYLAEAIGLSFTLGAFLAGVMISESLVNHEVFSETKSLRNIFSAVFYVALGSLISISFVLSNLFKVIVLVFIVLILKLFIIIGIVVSLEKQMRKAFLVGILLMQSGEFAFILAQLGTSNGWVSSEIYSLTIVVTVVSLLVTPFAVIHQEEWYRKIRECIRKRSLRLYNLFFISLDSFSTQQQEDTHVSVVICGFGRVGSYIGKALERSHISFTIIDSDPDVVDYCRKKGYGAIVGDATNSDILKEAKVGHAEFLAIALPKEASVEIIAARAKDLNSRIKVIARSHNPKEDERLKIKGVDITVEPEFEAAISMSRKILALSGKSTINIVEFLKRSKRRARSRHRT